MTAPSFPGGLAETNGVSSCGFLQLERGIFLDIFGTATKKKQLLPSLVERGFNNKVSFFSVAHRV